LHSNGLYSPYGKAYVSIDDKKWLILKGITVLNKYL
jgi:hypothetical protein